MVASLALLSVLALEPPLPPPPMVPANPPPSEPQPMPPPPPLSQPEPPAPPPPSYYEPPREPAPIPIDEGPGAAVRIPGAIGFAAIGAGATTVAWYFVANMRCSGNFTCGFGQVFLGIAATGLGYTAIMLTGWGGHRLFGGKSSLGWAALGTALGGVVGLALFYAISLGAARNTVLPAWAYVLATTASGAIGAGTMLEVGNYLVLREQHLVVLPIRDGGLVALAGTF